MDITGFSLRRQPRTISRNLILLIKISDTSHLFHDVQSGVTNRVRMQTPLPASLCKKNLLRQVKLPVGSSKKNWDDMTWAYPVPFHCHVFRYLPSKQDYIENSTAFPTHAARSCYKTCTNTLIVFLNTA